MINTPDIGYSDTPDYGGGPEDSIADLLKEYNIRYTSYDGVLDKLAEDGIYPSSITWDTYMGDVPFNTYGSVDLEFAPNYSFVDSMGINPNRLSTFLRSIEGSVSGYGYERLLLDDDDILDTVTWQETDRGHQVGIVLSSLAEVDPHMSIQLIDNAWAEGFEKAQLVSGNEVVKSRDIGFTPWW